jgi:hypothetical protein
MTEDSLRDVLQDLRTELARGNQRDPAVRARLEALMSELEVKLDRPDDGEHHETLVGSLRESLRNLGPQHPRATALLNRVMVALGEAGI